MRETLYEKLISYRDSDYYGFHMPGHKRNSELTGAELPYGIDITEIEGFDDLHHARGILQEAQERAARLYGAEETHYLVNGSTCGILSAIMGCTRKGDRILMARNCHKSAYHAAFLNELRVEYVYPGYLGEYDLNGEIGAEDVRRILKEDARVTGEECVPEDARVSREIRMSGAMRMSEKRGVAGESLACRGSIRAVVITSPTYDGVVSDVGAIAEVAHEYGIPLIVDEAHGAHFGFHPCFPQNANALGADVVIHSLHKTLPSLTQTALLHMNGNIVAREEVRRYLHIFQSSSPSYVLMAGMDECIRLLETKGETLFAEYVEILEGTRHALRKLRCLRLAEPSEAQFAEKIPRTRSADEVSKMRGGTSSSMQFDRSKIVVSAKGTGKSGKWLYQQLLERYHLQMEMAAGTYVIAMTSVGDTREGMERLVKALLEIDGQLWQNRSVGKFSEMDVESDLLQTMEEGFLEEGEPESSRLRVGRAFELPRPEQVYTSAEAVRMERDRRETRPGNQRTRDCRGMDERETDTSLPWEACEGRVSAEYAYLYPPGIPLLVPGERISREILERLELYRSLDFDIEGLERAGKIKVCGEP